MPFPLLAGRTLANDNEAAQASDDGDVSGDKPAAWSLEVGYDFEIADHGSSFAVAYQGTDEASGVELPEKAVIASLSTGIYKNTSLGLEFRNDEDYDGSDANTFTAKLAVDF